jgi:hypothetical protein
MTPGFCFAAAAQDGESLIFKRRQGGSHSGRYLRSNDDKMAIWLCDKATQPFISNVTSHTENGKIRRCCPVIDTTA